MAATGGREGRDLCQEGKGGGGGGDRLPVRAGAALHQGLDEEGAPWSEMGRASCWGGAIGCISPVGREEAGVLCDG